MRRWLRLTRARHPRTFTEFGRYLAKEARPHRGREVNGRFIAHLKEEDQNGGVRWDLKNTQGKRVGSGIYLYQAIFDNQKKVGKFTVIR